MPVVALTAVSNSTRLERFVLALSIGSLCAYAVELLAPALPAGWLGSRGYQALGSLVTLAPAALALLPAVTWPLRRRANVRIAQPS